MEDVTNRVGGAADEGRSCCAWDGMRVGWTLCVGGCVRGGRVSPSLPLCEVSVAGVIGCDCVVGWVVSDTNVGVVDCRSAVRPIWQITIQYN